jgi:hypothetical protein
MALQARRIELSAGTRGRFGALMLKARKPLTFEEALLEYFSRGARSEDEMNSLGNCCILLGGVFLVSRRATADNERCCEQQQDLRANTDAQLGSTGAGTWAALGRGGELPADDVDFTSASW